LIHSNKEPKRIQATSDFSGYNYTTFLEINQRYKGIFFLAIGKRVFSEQFLTHKSNAVFYE